MRKVINWQNEQTANERMIKCNYKFTVYYWFKIEADKLKSGQSALISPLRLFWG